MLRALPERLQIGEHQVPLKVRRNRRAKRMYLRYNPTDHGFDLTLPSRTRLEEGARFVNSKQDWIADTLAQMPSRKQLKPGIKIPLLGQYVRIRLDPDLPAPFALRDDVLYIKAPADEAPAAIEHALKKMARHELSELAEFKAQRLGKRINRITLRDTTSRWGSCSTDANLMFSWRLIFAPYEVLDYVVSHEVAHLQHMDHSPRFWHCVASICPDYASWKDWLRFHGKELYRFTAS